MRVGSERQAVQEETRRDRGLLVSTARNGIHDYEDGMDGDISNPEFARRLVRSGTSYRSSWNGEVSRE